MFATAGEEFSSNDNVPARNIARGILGRNDTDKRIRVKEGVQSIIPSPA